MPVSAISVVAGAVKSIGRPPCAEYAKCLPVAIPWSHRSVQRQCPGSGEFWSGEETHRN